MMVLISYDVCTTTSAGAARLRHVAKECQAHAQRVQASVFEADLPWDAFVRMKANLTAIIDPQHDSLRFYYLGNNWHKKIEHIGAKPAYNPEGTIIL